MCVFARDSPAGTWPSTPPPIILSHIEPPGNGQESHIWTRPSKVASLGTSLSREGKRWKIHSLEDPLSRLSHMQSGFQPGQLSLLCHLTKKGMVFLRIRAYPPGRPSGKSPMKRAYPTNMSLSETCHSHGRKFPCVLIHYRLINGKCLFLFPPSERWTVIV